MSYQRRIEVELYERVAGFFSRELDYIHCGMASRAILGYKETCGTLSRQNNKTKT